MSLSVIAATTGVNASGTTLTLAKPTGLQNGDLLIAALRGQTVGTADANLTGWTRITAPYVASDATGRTTGIFAHPVTDASSEPANYVFNIPSGGRLSGVVAIIRSSINAAIQYDGYSTPYSGSPITDGRRANGFASTRPSGLILAMIAGEFSSGQDHVPASLSAGFTEVGSAVTSTNLTTSRTLGALYAKPHAGGDVGNFDSTWVASSNLTAQSVLIAEAGVSTVVLERGDGASLLARLYDGTSEVDLSKVMTLPKANRKYTITDMERDIAQGIDVQWAHRGGSTDWSEMTMRAYTNAHWFGMKAFEISCVRSADGVFIMAHDNGIGRVTGVSTYDPITTNQSANLLGVPVTVPTSGGVIGRLEEALDAYKDYVLIVDNKTGADYPGFMNLLKTTVPDWREHVILKIADGSSVARFQQAYDAGFKVAPYFYDTTPVQDILDRLPYVHYAGMNNSAPVEYYNMLLDAGKTVWGHVLSTPSQYAEAKSKGAKIFQCASVTTLGRKINNV